MDIYCLWEFRKEYEKLLKNNSYSYLEEEIIKCFKDQQSAKDCLFGTNLNQSHTTPYIKKDIGGRGGFRLYYIALCDKNILCLGFVHPKKGAKGSDNTTPEFRSQLQKDIFQSLQSNSALKINFINNSIAFEEPQ